MFFFIICQLTVGDIKCHSVAVRTGISLVPILLSNIYPQVAAFAYNISIEIAFLNGTFVKLSGVAVLVYQNDVIGNGLFLVSFVL